MDQRGMQEEDGTLADKLNEQGKSVALQNTSREFGGATDEKTIGGKRSNLENAGQGGGSRNNKTYVAAGTKNAKVKVKGTNVKAFQAEGISDTDEAKVYLDKWCIGQTKCRKGGSTNVLVKIPIIGVLKVWVCGKVGIIWNRAQK